MQIIGSVQIVTIVTSVVPTLFGCIALFDLLVLLGFTVTFAFAVRMCRGVSLLRERFSGASRPPKNPLASWAQLDQLMDALLLLCRTSAAGAIFGFALSWARLNKKIKKPRLFKHTLQQWCKHCKPKCYQKLFQGQWCGCEYYLQERDIHCGKYYCC